MERGSSPIRRIVFDTIPTTTRDCGIGLEVDTVTMNITAELEGDVAHRIRSRSEHLSDARKTLWCGQRIGGQIHLFGLTGDLDGCKRNRIRELSLFWHTLTGRGTQSRAWAGKIKTVAG